MNNRRRFFTLGATSGHEHFVEQRSRASWLLQGALLLLLVGFTLTISASERDQERARALSSSGAIVPLENITAQVRARHIGDILEVEFESEDQGYFYEVEVVDATGVVRKLIYDAVTGEPLSDSPDD